MATQDLPALEIEGKTWEQERKRLLDKCGDAMERVLEQLASWKHAAQVAEAEKRVHKQRAKVLAMRLSRTEALLKQAKAVQHG